MNARHQLLTADRFAGHACDDAPYFEGCLPLEEMARRGRDTPRFGPLKPVGLPDPRTGREPHAVVQLRREDRAGQMWNLVGFHGAVLQEQDLASSGRITEGTGEITGAQYLVTGAVTSFKPSAAGGAGGAVLPNLGLNLGGGMKQAYIAIDMRVVDTTSSRLIFSTTVEGRARDFLGGMALPLGGGKTKTFIGLGGSVNTPMEKAVRVCIQNATDYVVSQVP